MITPQTVVVAQTNPDLTLGQFEAILEAGSSPALVESVQCYNAVVSVGLSPAFSLAIFMQESGLGTAGFAVVNKSPGNTRTTTTGIGITVQTTKGNFIRYPNWMEGFRDLAWRIVRPNGVYAQEGRKTIEQIITRWAPPENGNDTQGYIQSVVSNMNRWIGSSSMAPTYDYYQLNIIDKTGQLVYDGKTGSRSGYVIKEVILHETAGPNDKKNATGTQAQALDNATLNWFLKTANQLSIHYFLGGENNGAPVYRCCPESVMAYHAIGNKGSVNGSSVENHISIGIERMGQPNDGPVGPLQTAALCKLVLDICRRNHLTADNIFAHADVQPDKRDGRTIIQLVKDYVNANLGVSTVSNTNQGPKPQTLPYGVTVDGAGALVFQNGVPLNYGFKDSFLTLFGNVPQGDDLGAAILRGVKMYGLPVKPEALTPDGSEQEFELCFFHYNKNEAAGWQLRLAKKSQAA